MKKIWIIILLSLFMNVHVIYAEQTMEDTAQSALEKATESYEKKDYQQAIKWLKKSFKINPSSEVALNLGIIYKKTKNYSKAIEWLEKSYDLGEVGGGYTLGNLYKEIGDISNAIKWYKKAIKNGHVSAMKNLANLYKAQKNYMLGSAYMLGLIDKGYTKQEVISHLRDDWKIDEATIKEAYKLQLTLIPNPYRDSEFEEETKKRRSGRR